MDPFMGNLGKASCGGGSRNHNGRMVYTFCMDLLLENSNREKFMSQIIVMHITQEGGFSNLISREILKPLFTYLVWETYLINV